MCCQDWRIQFDSWPRYWGCQVAVLYSEIFHGCKHWHCELCCLIQRHQDGNQSSLILFPQHFTKFVIDLKYSSTTEDMIYVNFEENISAKTSSIVFLLMMINRLLIQSTWGCSIGQPFVKETAILAKINTSWWWFITLINQSSSIVTYHNF